MKAYQGFDAEGIVGELNLIIMELQGELVAADGHSVVGEADVASGHAASLAFERFGSIAKGFSRFAKVSLCVRLKHPIPLG